MKKQTLVVQGAEVTIVSRHEKDFISLTDMVRKFGDESILYNWLRNRNTIEFLGIWEQIYKPAFKPIEFERFKNQAGLNSFSLSPKKWIEATGAIGLYAKSGRGGGTFAHRDIAFEFGSWLSPEFKLYLIREFQRLKDEESRSQALEWNFQRTPAKVNYKIHTDLKEVRRSAAILPTLEVKLSWLKKQRELDGKRRRLRRELFARQGEVEAQRNDLISQLEAQLQQRVEERTLFTVEWELQ